MKLPDRKTCTGCGACFDSCPKKAILFENDYEGFLQVKIDANKCISCGKCEKACPVNNRQKIERYLSPLVYAAWHKDETIRLLSTSGGIFSAFAELIFHKGGYVGGAVYTENHLVRQIISDSPDDLAALRRSKYVQSDARGFYRAIQQALQSGKEVFCCATPCQIAALYNFLGGSHKGLTTCDFVCLGVNSPKVFDKYLGYLETLYDSKITTIEFKDKTYGWQTFSTKVEFQNGQIYCQDRYHDLYMRGYLKPNNFARPCCYDCRFKIIPHSADITLADFWGVNKIDPTLDNDQGTSLVLVNSEQGKMLFEAVASTIYCKECSIEDALPGNTALFHSMKRLDRREEFYCDLDLLPFDQLIEKHTPKLPLRKKIRRLMSSILKKKKLIHTSR